MGRPLTGERLVVVAPHPDDEVLQAGGLLYHWQASGRPILIVAVTDGEASHAESTRVTPAVLREWRSRERDHALGELGLENAPVRRLREPDQGCAARVIPIVCALRAMWKAGDVVVGPAPEDRHPDHVAVAEAVRLAAAGLLDAVWAAPTWAHVHRVAAEPTSELELSDEAWTAKQRAIREYQSQTSAIGPDAVDGPVVRPHELLAMMRRREHFREVPTP